MTGELDWGAWHDTHRARVEKLVRDKRAGRTPRARRFKPAVVRDDGLTAALKASLKRAG
jgi:non-homologous end joining protein Ku